MAGSLATLFLKPLTRQQCQIFKTKHLKLCENISFAYYYV